jgi:hypothetical protein
MDSIHDVRNEIARMLGNNRQDIVTVVQGPVAEDGPGIVFRERELRIIRFCLDRALESF